MRYINNMTMTFQQKVAALKVEYSPFYRYVAGWRYSNRSCFAENIATGELFRGSWEEFLIEKRIIDVLNCDEDYERLKISTM
jgi:hypothetical protein